MSKCFLISSCPVLYVESGDILALIAAVAIVIFVAIVANPPDLSEKPVPSGNVTQPAETGTQSLPPATTMVPGVSPTSTTRDEQLHRIYYTDKPFSYPEYRMPENMETFGASEIPGKNQEWVPFAVIEESRGGLTQVFSVPYPVWVINTTVTAGIHPQYSNLRFALCYADTGGIIEGEEILNQGTSYRVVQTSNTDMYLIIATQNIDSFRIYLETPREYFDANSSGYYG
jgi:hypothetical protein